MVAGIFVATIACLAAVAAGVGARVLWRRNRVSTGTPGGLIPDRLAPDGLPADGVSHSSEATSQHLTGDAMLVESVNAVAAERLWRLAFATPDVVVQLGPEHAEIRDSVTAELHAEQFDPTYFARRPTLMPQLLQMVNDPDATADAVANIIAQDPVLAGNVLRLANSSFYRVASEPVETIQKAIIICGMDSLQKLLAIALLQPVFRATDKNFPLFPPLLWLRTERSALAAELYAAQTRRQDRFEAQMVALLSALGPLVVYRATVAAYARAPGLSPSPDLCVALIGTLGQRTSQSIARHWESSPRLIGALGPSEQDPDAASEHSLALALYSGELIGTLSLLESRRNISANFRMRLAEKAGLPEEITATIWDRLTLPRD